MRISRRKFVGGLVGAAVAGYADVRWIEPRWLATGRQDLKLPGPGAASISLLHVSDFHASEDVSLHFIQKAIRRGVQLKPDLICLTGDFITWRYDAFNRYAEILKPLADTAPTFATLGNHDGGRWVGSAGYSDTALVQDMLKQARVEVLHNRSTTVRLQGRDLQLVGVGDLWAGEVDARAAFAGTKQGESTILLSHNPDSKEELEAYPWDLMLCGHTHGGQCDLVFFGTPFAPVSDKRFVRGLHRWGNRWIHITKGLGNLYSARFNCRPEISLLTLR